MRKLIFPFCMAMGLTAGAQQPEGKASIAPAKQMKEGRIVYERVAQTPVRMFRNDSEVINQLPKSRTDQYELLFGNNQSLYQFIPSAVNENANEITAGGGTMVVRFGGMNDVGYTDLSKGIRVDQREIMERSFVVVDSLQKGSWKLTEETKIVLNYVVRKAIGTRIANRPQMTMENGEMKRTMITDTLKIIAWFTTDIPVAVGPESQGQLPGAILEMDVNNGQIVYRAIEISPKVNVAKIKEPSEGKRVTAAQFSEERDKIMDEMRRNMPPGSRQVIRMN